MSEFKNVTVVKKANVYFDGKVVSRTVLFPDGSKNTRGIMQPGEYEFSTADKEIMEILSGELDVMLPGAKAVEGGQGRRVLRGACQREDHDEGQDAVRLLLFLREVAAGRPVR